MDKKLFIPGPVSVLPEVLQAMTKPMIGHRSSDASILQKDISDKMRKVMFTKEEILLSTTSGSGLMEGAVRSGSKKRVAVFSIGAFGERWYKMAKTNHVEADIFESEMGKPTTPEMVSKALLTGKYDMVTITHNETSTGVMNPVKDIAEVISKYPEVIFALDTVSSLGGTRIPFDDLGVDIGVTSSQKCLGLPPGISMASFSEKAVHRAKEIDHRGFYLDLLKLYETIQKKNYQYPSTPAISLMYALDYQLDRILKVEGLENRFERHRKMADYTRAWAKEYFDVFPEEGYESNTLTAIKNTREISIKNLNQKLQEKGYVISNGYGDLKEKTFRIAHMADTRFDDLKDLLKTIEKLL